MHYAHTLLSKHAKPIFVFVVGSGIYHDTKSALHYSAKPSSILPDTTHGAEDTQWFPEVYCPCSSQCFAFSDCRPNSSRSSAPQMRTCKSHPSHCSSCNSAKMKSGVKFCKMKSGAKLRRQIQNGMSLYFIFVLGDVSCICRMLSDHSGSPSMTS